MLADYATRHAVTVESLSCDSTRGKLSRPAPGRAGGGPWRTRTFRSVIRACWARVDVIALCNKRTANEYMLNKDGVSSFDNVRRYVDLTMFSMELLIVITQCNAQCVRPIGRVML